MTARAVLIVLLAWLPAAVQAQASPTPATPGWSAPDAPRSVPADVLDELRANPDYQYDPANAETAISWSDRLQRWLFDWILSLFEEGEVEMSTVGQVIRWVLYALAAVILGWALLRLVRMEGTSPLARGAGAVPAQADLADAARPPADLTALLDEAARGGRYAEAVRWQYLRLLGALGRAGLLDLQPSKTNRRYRADLAGHALGPDFARGSQLFDRVVYGGVDLDHERYAVVSERLTAVEQALAEFSGGSPQPVAA